MDALADRHADRAVRSAFIYVREAHPGENYPHLTSMDQKRDHARVLKKNLGLKREIFLDDLQGSTHLAYGGLPNMTWIIGRGGIIQYKAAWTNVEDVEDALLKTLHAFDKRARTGLLPFYSERTCWRERDDEAFRAGLEKIGPQAVSDFFDKPRPKVPAGALDKG